MPEITLSPEDDPFADVPSNGVLLTDAEQHVAYMIWIEDAPRAEVERHCKKMGIYPDLFADDPKPECTGNVVNFAAYRANKAD